MDVSDVVASAPGTGTVLGMHDCSLLSLSRSLLLSLSFLVSSMNITCHNCHVALLLKPTVVGEVVGTIRLPSVQATLQLVSRARPLFAQGVID